MKLLFLSALLAINISGIAQSVDTSNYAILKFKRQDYIFPKDYKNTTLNKTEIDQIETILKKCIADYNRNQLIKYNEWHKKDSTIEKGDWIITLDHKNRQYIAAVNNKNEKEVWVNCFPIVIYDETGTQEYSWKKYIKVVEDGGSRFFNVKINLTKKLFYNLIVNGF